MCEQCEKSIKMMIEAIEHSFHEHTVTFVVTQGRKEDAQGLAAVWGEEGAILQQIYSACKNDPRVREIIMEVAMRLATDRMSEILGGPNEEKRLRDDLTEALQYARAKKPAGDC